MPEVDIPTLVSWVEANKIRIPTFQREFAWTENDVALLADSVYKRYPIGILTFFEVEPGVYYVLDGQQRIFSLYMLFGRQVEIDGNYISVDVWVNPLNYPPIFKASKRRLSYPWVKLSDIVNKDPKELPELARKIAKSVLPGVIDEGKLLGILNDIWMAFRNYKVLYYVVQRDVSIDDLGEIYDRINFAGKKVGYADIIYSIIAIKDENIARNLRVFYHELKREQWDLDFSVLVRAFLAIISDGKVKLGNRVLEQAEKVKEVFENKKGELTQLFEAFKNSVKNSIDMLSHDDTLAIKSADKRLLVSEAPLIVVFYYTYKFGKPVSLRVEDKLLLKWFVLSQYHRRYSSAAETKLNEDLEVLRFKGVKGLIEKLKQYVGAGLLPDENELKGTNKDKLLLLYSLLKLNGATDLFDVNEKLNSYFTVHHIFPKAIVGDELGDDIANITFAKESTNKRLRDKKPSEYLSSISENVLQRHFIPLDKTLWRNYEAFIEARRKLIVQGIRKLFSEFLPSFEQE